MGCFKTVIIGQEADYWRIERNIKRAYAHGNRDKQRVIQPVVQAATPLNSVLYMIGLEEQV
jgi:hypothetical protein